MHITAVRCAVYKEGVLKKPRRRRQTRIIRVDPKQIWHDEDSCPVCLPFNNAENPDSMQTKHELPHASQGKHTGEKTPPLAIVAEHPARVRATPRRFREAYLIGDLRAKKLSVCSSPPGYMLICSASGKHTPNFARLATSDRAFPTGLVQHIELSPETH